MTRPQVEIQEMSSTVGVMDGEALLSPRVLGQVVRLVLQAVRDDEAHRRRVLYERRVDAGRTDGGL